MKQEFRFTKRDTPGLLIKLRTFFGSLDDKTEYRMTVDKVRKNRSLDANAYFWVLCDKVAEAVGVPKTEIYRGYIKDVGGICPSNTGLSSCSARNATRRATFRRIGVQAQTERSNAQDSENLSAHTVARNL